VAQRPRQVHDIVAPRLRPVDQPGVDIEALGQRQIQGAQSGDQIAPALARRAASNPCVEDDDL
jgi:hypothetical protein